MEYEIIVVGGGHAGCEASLAAARKNHKTLLVTGNIKNIADMPCNPSIGGSAKGIVVREIDALGGEMGKNADKSLLQIKMLNNKKGPAIQALRAQADKITYPKNMLKTLNNTPNLTIKEAIVENLIVEDNKIKGIIMEDGTTIFISSHILSEVDLLADTIGIIQHGKLLTELPIEEIHKHQTDYISLQVDDVTRVAALLENMRITNFSVLDKEFIHIYDSDISGKALSKAIIENGIGLESMGRKQDTLEDFFFQLTEEEK